MPMISIIGRKEPKVRFLIWGIYLALTLGSLTMVYPFLLMLSGSTKSSVDTPDAVVIPRYLVDDTALYRKHIEALFNETPSEMQNAYGLWDETFLRISPPSESSPLVADWKRFLSTQPQSAQNFILGYLDCPLSRNVIPYMLRKFRSELLKEYKTIENINEEFGTTFASASAFRVIPPNYLNRFVDFPTDAFSRRLEAFSLAQDDTWKCYVSLTNFYRTFLQILYGKDITGYNATHHTEFTDWSEVPLGRTAADSGTWAKSDFEDFVRNVLNPVFVTLDSSATESYRHYLSRKYADGIEELNARYGTHYADFSEIPLSATLPLEGVVKADWRGFLEGWKDPQTGEFLFAPLESVRLKGVDFTFRDDLKNTYGSLEKMNAQLRTHFSSWEVVPMPQRDFQYENFQSQTGWLRWQFTIRNYLDVWEYLVINGRGLLNTVIYCALAVLAALTVDPIAAYALSRFKPSSTYKILLFLMMTMAFPAMVTQIPMFLLLRDLGMLNTFWALVLPGLANGYNIFLLKGFFDSLPRELYESAEIDGASELAIFLQITMALSKPILAVIALAAFTSAYAAFMFALLLCQDPQMWTLMVWLYQLQQYSGQGIIFASLIIAAIPTFAVFVACQNVIMRGIVVPVEK